MGLDWPWQLLKISILILPLIPSLGALGLFISLLITWQHKYKSIIQKPINWGFAILGIWLIINSFLAFKPTEAFLGLVNFLPFFFLLAGFSILIEKISQLEQLAWMLIMPSPIVVILGLGQLFLSWSFPLLLGWELIPQGNPTGRIASVFMYANILTAYLLIVLFLSLGLWLKHYQERLINKGFWLLTFTVIINGIGLILTNSRNGWAIAFFGALAFAIYLGWYWLVGIVASLISLILGAAFAPTSIAMWLRKIVPAYFWARLTDEMYPHRPIATLRATQWQFCLNLMQQRPLTGWGMRNFTPLYEAKMNIWLGHPHSLWLMLMAEIGIPATILFAGLVGWILAQIVRLMSRIKPKDKLILFTYLVAFTSIILFNLFDVTIFDLRVNTLSWLLLSALAGVGYHQPNKQILST